MLRKKGRFIDTNKHFNLKSPLTLHSLSAHRGFLGCGHFKQTNNLLAQQGRTPINWQLDPIK